MTLTDLLESTTAHVVAIAALITALTYLGRLALKAGRWVRRILNAIFDLLDDELTHNHGSSIKDDIYGMAVTLGNVSRDVEDMKADLYSHLAEKGPKNTMTTKKKAAPVPISQNGWRGLAPSSPLLHTWVIPGQSGTTKIRMRNGSAGFLLAHLALWFDGKVEDLVEPVLDDWGYAYRPVRGYAKVLSNHASGTAIDLNATDHPLAKVGTFTTGEARAIRRRLRFYGGAIRWGGDYRNRRDEMHFEIDAPLQDVEARARQLLDSPRGGVLLKANPGQRAVILS